LNLSLVVSYHDRCAVVFLSPASKNL
jgi:hypothetical protein